MLLGVRLRIRSWAASAVGVTLVDANLLRRLGPACATVPSEDLAWAKAGVGADFRTAGCIERVRGPSMWRMRTRPSWPSRETLQRMAFASAASNVVSARLAARPTHLSPYGLTYRLVRSGPKRRTPRGLRSSRESH